MCGSFIRHSFKSGKWTLSSLQIFCLFFWLSQENLEVLKQIKPDFTLSHVDCMPKKWFVFFDLAL